MSGTWMRVVATAGLVVGGLACGSDDEATVPTATELASRLVDVDTFDGDWAIDIPDDAPEWATSGVVPAEMADQLPRMDLCEAASAEARALVEDIPWMAFRQIALTVDDPIDPPDDRTGHMVSVQEFLLADEPVMAAEMYGTLRDGMEACLGEVPAGEEGPGLAEVMALPEIGDDRYGALLTVEEAGGWAEWRLHSALVRDGTVLAWVLVIDIRADAEPYFTVDQVGRMVETAVGLL